MSEIYGTVEGFKAYHTERGNAYVDDDTTITSAQLRASEFIDGNYQAGFPGIKTGLRGQEREWPRTSTDDSPVVDIYNNFIASTEIPVEVINASYEAALREQETPGTLQPDVRPSDRRSAVAVSGAVSVTYANIASDNVDAYRLIVTKIDAILAPILTNGNGFASFAGKGYRI